MQSLLGLLHGTDFLITHLLLGFLIFRSVIVTAGGPKAIEIYSGWHNKTLILIRLGFFSSLTWMILTVHEMTESWAPRDLWIGLGETSFAHVWCLKLLFFGLFAFFNFRNAKLQILQLCDSSFGAVSPFCVCSYRSFGRCRRVSHCKNVC